MASIDLSRSATDYRKHYKSVYAQQGRVFVDDDHNENESVHGEEARNEIVEIVGPVGAPGDGFLLSNPRLTGGKIDFDLAAGSLYVGGYRLNLDAPTTFQKQPDWLEIFGSATLNAPAAARSDLVYVETYLTPVTSVEDSETFEVALGGPDTAVRMKQMERVRVFTGFAGVDCQDGWKALGASFKTGKRGTLNAQNELIPDTQLTVSFAKNGTDDDLCSPPIAGGYLGAENQALRVQIVDQTHFTWGFDNASPLYRVKVDKVAGLLTQVTMITEPKDQAHWPSAGQVVEFLPWSAVLPNNEKTAEISGFLTRVASSYDPGLKQFTIDPTNPVSGTFGLDWKQRADAAALAPGAGDTFFYMRVWNRGGDTTSPVAIPFVSGTAVDLLGTGLQVTFTGNDRPFADYWIIAARPDSPNLVVPWALQAGKAPNGYRHFFAPLGVIQWSAAGAGALSGKVVDDCRQPFLPLTRIRGCCTFTVGDGETSFGKFTSIQAAIDALPTTGGEVCILAGTFTENFQIVGGTNITIHGCGGRTILTPKNTAAPIAFIQDSQYISIRSVQMVANTAMAIAILSTPDAIKSQSACDRIAIRGIDFEIRDASAIGCFYATNVLIVENNIHANPLVTALLVTSAAGMAPAILLFGENVEIARNRIVADVERALNTASGGIQLFGICEGIRIENNHIEGGNGNGVTLGAVFWVDSNVSPATGLGTGWGLIFYWGIWIDAGGCVHIGWGGPPPTGGDGKPQIPVAWGFFTDIHILNNKIVNMGQSGIGSPDLPARTVGLPVVEGIEIVHNEITGCAALDRSTAALASGSALPGRGGVALIMAGGALIRDNWIALNGPSFVPSICGVWIGIGSGVVLERNNILDNGPSTETQQQFEAGPRGGIRVELALPAVSLNPDNIAGWIETEFPALRVHDNVVVAPSGPALAALAIGPVSAGSNELTSGVPDGVSRKSAWPMDILRSLLGGAAVFILDIGTLSEISSTAVDFATAGFFPDAKAGSESTKSVDPNFISGDILFNGNRVLLNFPDAGQNAITSSVTLFSLADIGAEGNQFTARTGNHPLYTNVYAVGFSLRLAGNRCQDRFDAGFSGTTVAIMNTTTNNQGSRCFYAVGNPSLLIDTPNTSWVDLINRDLCQSVRAALDKYYTVAAYSSGH